MHLTTGKCSVSSIRHSPNSAYPQRFGPTTDLPSRLSVLVGSRSFRFGGCAWVFASSASNQHSQEPSFSLSSREWHGLRRLPLASPPTEISSSVALPVAESGSPVPITARRQDVPALRLPAQRRRSGSSWWGRVSRRAEPSRSFGGVLNRRMVSLTVPFAASTAGHRTSLLRSYCAKPLPRCTPRR